MSQTCRNWKKGQIIFCCLRSPPSSTDAVSKETLARLARLGTVTPADHSSPSSGPRKHGPCMTKAISVCESFGLPTSLWRSRDPPPDEKRNQPIDTTFARPKMLAVRQRAACIAQRARPATRTTRQATRAYASDHGHGADDHHHHAPQVEESPGVRILPWVDGCCYAGADDLTDCAL